MAINIKVLFQKAFLMKCANDPGGEKEFGRASLTEICSEDVR